MKYSVTGNTEIPIDAYKILSHALTEITEVEEFNTGGADGIDTEAAKLAWQLFDRVNVVHRLFYPEGKYWNKETLNYTNVHIPVPGGYLKRDDALAEACDILLAFPRNGFEIMRSGTWATVRRARKANRIIVFYPLDGSDIWTEYPI